MKECKGNLWDYYNIPSVVILITTNGFVKKNGAAVMGRGCALEAFRRFPELPFVLGRALKEGGNKPYWLRDGILSFPVKHNWWEKADLDLIYKSALYLNREATNHPHIMYVLPRPGCGNGKLTWGEVKPVLEFLPDNVVVISYE